MYQKATLSNGIKIIAETIPNLHSVSLGVWVGAGSRFEEQRYNGISHFIEHMFFKGTNRRTTKQIAEEIDAVGGQLNAFTTKEYTCYYAKVLGQHFRMGVDLLADMVTNSLFATEEIAKEKSVVLEEIKSFEDSPDEIIHDILAGSVLKNHPLGWTILGTPDSISRINRDTIIDYLSHHYTPDNIVFAVAGNVQFDQIITEVEEGFSKISGSLVQELAPIPELQTEVVIKNKDTEQVHLCLGTRGVKRQDQDKYAIFVLDSILGGSVSSRLFQQLREERGLVYVTGSNHSSFRDTGIFSIYAGTSPQNFEQVIKIIKNEISKLQAKPVGEKELSRAKEQLKGNLLLSLESSCNRMSRIAKIELFQDQLLTPEESVAKIEAVSAEDVLRVARNLLDERRITLSAIGPFPKKAEGMEKAFYEY